MIIDEREQKKNISFLSREDLNNKKTLSERTDKKERTCCLEMENLPQLT